jgi:hypothetical protein
MGSIWLRIYRHSVFFFLERGCSNTSLKSSSIAKYVNLRDVKHTHTHTQTHEIRGPSDAKDLASARRSDDLYGPSMRSSISAEDCERDVISAVRNVTKAAYGISMSYRNRDKPTNREENPSVGLQIWCEEKMFGKKTVYVPEDVVSQLCSDLKGYYDDAMDREEKHPEVFASKKFCTEARRAVLQNLRSEVDAESFSGMDLAKRFQINQKHLDDDKAHRSFDDQGNGKVVSFYGERAHDSLEEAQWDPVASCCSLHETKGCKDVDITACVCERDAYCCQHSWDSRCIQAVDLFGCGTCQTETSKKNTKKSSESGKKSSGDSETKKTSTRNNESSSSKR